MITDGLLKTPQMPGAFGAGSDDQPAQAAEEALKKRREKLAQEKLHLGPESDASV